MTGSTENILEAECTYVAAAGT